MIFEKTFMSEGIPVTLISGVEFFSPRLVFDCGQSFRFEQVKNTPHDCEFAGVAYGKYISVALEGDRLYIYNVNEDEWNTTFCSYFGLDRDYRQIQDSIRSLSQNPALSSAIEKSSGIRILRQEPWEALCSFIISQNNNIPRIKGLISALSYKCGNPCDLTGMEEHIADAHRSVLGSTYTFPTPESLTALGVDGLRELKTGFRAKYIYDACTRVLSGQTDLCLIDKMSTKEAISSLCEICGVGPKVASCALLFGYSKLDAFPIDVWIKKVIAKYFDDDFSPESLGEYAGVAQQYLFYYERYLNGENV